MGREGWNEVKDIRLRFWKVALSRSARLAQSEFPAGRRTLYFTYTPHNSRTKPRGLIASFRKEKPQTSTCFSKAPRCEFVRSCHANLLTIKDLLLVERETW